MAKLVSVESELRAIRTICDGIPDAQRLCMAILNPFHFGFEEAREAFERIAGLAKAGKPIPKVSVLVSDPALSETAQQFLGGDNLELCEDEAEAHSLIDQLEQFRKLRVIYQGTRSVVGNLQEANPDSINDALSELERVIVQARQDYEDTGIVTSGQGSNAEPVIDKVLSRDAPDRILTGFTEFDQKAGGFARKDLVLAAATTGGGKSVMAEQLAINSYRMFNKNVAMVSFEMDEAEIYARLVSNLAEVPFTNVYLHQFLVGEVGKTKDRRQDCYDAWSKFDGHGEKNNCRFSIWCPTVEVTPAQIGATLKPGHFDLVLIDYVGLVGADNKAALWENLGDITKQFKLMANEQNCVVIVFAQLDEETNNVKYSKAMRHHSSWVWKWAYGEQEKEVQQVKIYQDKCRHSEQFDFALMAKFAYMRFGDAGSAGPVIGPDDDDDVSSKDENAANEAKNQYRARLSAAASAVKTTVAVPPVPVEAKPKSRLEKKLDQVNTNDFDPEDE